MRHSDRRDAIFAELKNSCAHPSAEMIFSAIKPNFADLSLGTVYRNLTLFKECGDIVSVGVVDGKERFDADTSPHNHFICRNCGAVIDIPDKFRIGVEDIEADGVQIESVDIVFHGLCKSCADAEHN